MTKKLKVYGGCYDGTWRVIAAATSLAEFYRILIKAGFNVSVRDITTYGGETGNANEIALATANPGVVFKKKASTNDEFVRHKR